MERSRISKDIHDGLQQTLTISSLNFQAVTKGLNNMGELMKEKFEVGWKYLQESIKESRVVAHSLMPKAIVDFGVISAFQNLIDDMNKVSEKTDFNFYHNFETEKIENEQIEITFYRILQEAINNINKYAEASRVDVQLKDYDDIYMLTIEDNGVGFDADKIKENESGLGFRSMRNRVEAIEGIIEIDSQIGRGTSILVEINKTT
jgi:signal transduction histidine kinase